MPRPPRNIVQWIPWSLVGLRALLGFLIPLLSRYWPNAAVLAFCIVLGLISDIFDGIIARRLGVATSFLRRADSAVDVFFYLSIVAGLCILRPHIVQHHWLGLALIVALEIVCHVISFIRFSKPPATHTYLAKSWGLLLAASCIAMLAFNYEGLLVWVTVGVGVLVDIEVLTIMLISQTPPVDVPSLAHAMRGRVCPRCAANATRA